MCVNLCGQGVHRKSGALYLFLCFKNYYVVTDWAVFSSIFDFFLVRVLYSTVLDLQISKIHAFSFPHLYRIYYLHFSEVNQINSHHPIKLLYLMSWVTSLVPRIFFYKKIVNLLAKRLALARSCTRLLLARLRAIVHIIVCTFFC